MAIKVEGICPHYNNEGLVITYFENKQQVQSIYKPTPQEALSIIHYLSAMLLEKEKQEWKEYNDEMDEMYPQCNCHEYGDGRCTCNSSEVNSD